MRKFVALFVLALFLIPNIQASEDCKATALFIPSNSDPFMGDVVEFENLSEKAHHYEWYVNDYLSSTEESFSKYFNGAGNFVIELKAFDKNECSTSYSQEFIIERKARYFDEHSEHQHNHIEVDETNGAASLEEVKIYDRFGNEYAKEELIIPNNTWTAGIFVLHFDDEDNNTGSGFDDAASGTYFATKGQDRREVVIQVFEDLSELITNGGSLPNPYTGITPNTQVEIRISTNIDFSGNPMPAGAAGIGSSFYLDYPNSGIVHGVAWKTITSGIDAYNGLLNAPAFHGRMSLRIDNSINWYLNLSGGTIGSNQNDMYTVVLHEALHILGFASLIDNNGTSKFGNGNYAGFDTFLKSGGSNLITTSTNCYDHQFSGSTSSLIGGCNSIVFDGSGSNNANHVVYSPNSWAGGSSLSHFNCVCALTNNGYTMNFCTGPGAASMQRTPHASEAETLCDLGYDVQSNYGNGDYTASTTTSNPYSGCSNSTVAGVNDYRDFNTTNTGTQFSVTSTPSTVFTKSASPHILSNDFGGANQMACLEEVFPGSGTANLTGSTTSSISYDPPDYWGGTAVLRYRPFNSGTSTYGNVTYIYINVQAATPPCDTTTCNLVCQGDFEIFPSGIATIGFPYTDFRNSGTNSPDIGTFSSNEYAVIGAYGTNLEGLTFALKRPIDTGCVVNITFKAAGLLNNISTTPVRVTIAGSQNIPCAQSWGAINTFCPASSYTCGTTYQPVCPPMVQANITSASGAYPPSGNPNLQTYTYTWTNTSGAPINHITVNADNTQGFLLIDDIEVISQCDPQLSITPTVTPANPCVGGTVSVDYQICIPSGVASNASDIDLAASFPFTSNLSFGTGGDFNGSGLATIPAGALTTSNPCTTLTLNLNISNSAVAGLPLTTVLGITSGGCINSQTSTDSVDIVPGVNNALSITKTSSGAPFLPGSTVTYSIVVQNTSLTANITNIQFDDVLSGSFDLSSILYSGGMTLSGSTLTANPFNLGPGQSQTFTISIDVDTIKPCGQIFNCANVFSADGACTLPSSCDTLLVFGNITPPIGLSDTMYCFGEPMANLIGIPQSAGTLFWYDGIVGPPPYFLGIGTSLTPPHTAAGTYNYLVLETVNGCPSVPDTVTVIIKPPVNPTITPNPVGILCTSDLPVQLTGTPAGGTWLGGTVSGTGLFDPALAGVGTHTVGYAAYGPDTICYDSTFMTITVVSPPSTPVISPPGVVCTDAQSFELQATPIGGVWSGSFVTAGGVFTPPSTPGSYTVTYTVSISSTCFSSASITINVTPTNWQQIGGGGSGTSERGEDVQVDEAGNVYVTGATGGSSTFGAPNNPTIVNGPGFIAKYDECGDLIWINNMPAPGLSLVLDVNQQNVIVTGGRNGGAYLRSYSASGTLNWTEVMMSASPTIPAYGTSIDRDYSDIIYVTGYYERYLAFAGFPPLSGAGTRDGFVAQYDPSSNTWIAVNQLATTTPSGQITPRGIAVEESANWVYVSGDYIDNSSFAGPMLFGSGPFISEHVTATNLSGSAAVNPATTFGWPVSTIHEVDWNDLSPELYAAGDNIVGQVFAGLTTTAWAQTGMSPQDVFLDLHFDSNSWGLYVSGFEQGPDHALVARFDPTGGGPLWTSYSTHFSGGLDRANGVAVNSSNAFPWGDKVFSTGEFIADIQFPGSTSHSASGFSDAFIARVRDVVSSGSFFRTKEGSIAEVEEEDLKLKLFPNPFSENFSIEFEEGFEDESISIEITDIQGRRVYYSENTPIGKRIDLDLGALSKGLYVIKVKQKDALFIDKITKQ